MEGFLEMSRDYVLMRNKNMYNYLTGGIASIIALLMALLILKDHNPALVMIAACVVIITVVKIINSFSSQIITNHKKMMKEQLKYLQRIVDKNGYEQYRNFEDSEGGDDSLGAAAVRAKKALKAFDFLKDKLD
ncbi:MAG TPA: hypothetical protein VGE63_00485 [Candidatus Paceibacterota bacterium]